jgi:metal-responsive CopG/Arc/MetJ family transcriptional regulator
MGKKKQSESEVSNNVDFKISIGYSLLTSFTEEAKRHGFSTRSEAVRESMRRQLEIWTGRRY